MKLLLILLRCVSAGVSCCAWLLQSPSSRDKTPPCETDTAVSNSLQGSLDSHSVLCHLSDGKSEITESEQRALEKQYVCQLMLLADYDYRMMMMMTMMMMMIKKHYKKHSCQDSVTKAMMETTKLNV